MLTGKTVIIAGAAGLLGKRFSCAVASHGGTVIVADLDVAAASRVAEEIAVNPDSHAVPACLDITSERSVADLLSMLKRQYGKVDAVVNAAYPRNRNYGRQLENVTYQDFCQNVTMHLGGYFLVSQQFGLMFRELGGGNIVNIASVYGTMTPRFDLYAGTGMTMPVEYAAIKAAVIQLTRYFAQYFKSDGIRVNALSPGGILDHQSEQFLDRYNAHCGAKGMLDTGDIDGSLIFLLSDASKYITGQNLIVDDGFSL